MDSKELLLLFVSLGLLGGLRLTSTTTTTTFVAAMSIANQDLERYFRTTNNTQSLTAMTEERIAMDLYTYAFLNYSYVSAQHPEPVFSTYTEEKARYGEGRMFNVRGKLVHVTDAGALATDYACSPHILGTRGEPTPPPGVTWIALVRRGNCTFEEKVKNVHAKGAAGVIIYNDKQVTNLEKMQIKVKNRNITAVITFDYVGEEMARIVDQGNEMMAAIIEGRSGMRPINTLNRTSVLFVSISFIVLMIISLVWLIFYYIQRFRYLQTKDQQSRHLCSVTKKAIMKIPTKTGKVSDEKDADSDCCAICIEAYKPSDCIRVLPCKHEFHKNCIDPWLIEHRTCPMCKLDVLKFYGYVFLGSEESILEYEPDRVAPVGPGAAGVIAEAPQRPSALVDLIRSRDFVIDFPRIFVLEAGASAGSRDEFFPRSQSSLSLAHAKDWMSQMSNKLEEQQVLRRARKASVPYEMQENLLHVRSDSTRRLRSRSADGRYSSGVGGCFARQSSTDSVDEGNPHHGDVVIQCEGVGGGRPSRRGSGGRRNSSALRVLTDASYAQSIQRRHEEMQQQLRRTRRESLRRTSVGAASREMPPSREMRPSRELPPSERQEAAGGRGQEGGDVAIQIQVNGEGINF